MKFCLSCSKNKASLIRPKTRKPICLECFYLEFEEEIHLTITANKLICKGDKIALGASGGKDSTVLIHVINELNKRHDYQAELVLLSIDEGIVGYRDDSLETVKSNEKTYKLLLTILSYKELYGWTMDEIVKEIGQTNNCTFCGVFRRQALERGALLLGCNKIALGHNADDIAETVLLNVLRGDHNRLGTSVEPMTGDDSGIPRIKPFKYSYQKEIVLYAYHKKLEYFSTECVYAPFAYRGFVRDLIKNLENINPSYIMNIVHSGEQFQVNTEKPREKNKCQNCGFLTSQKICKACIHLQRLNSSKKKIILEIEKVQLTLGIFCCNDEYQHDSNYKPLHLWFFIKQYSDISDIWQVSFNSPYQMFLVSPQRTSFIQPSIIYIIVISFSQQIKIFVSFKINDFSYFKMALCTIGISQSFILNTTTSPGIIGSE